MKKSSIKRTISILIILALLSSVNLAFASSEDRYIDEPVNVDYTHIESMAAGLDINSIGYSTNIGYAVASSGSYTVELHVTLRNENGVVQTWTDTSTSYVYLEENYYVASGHSYYVFVYVRILNSYGTVLETAYMNSRTVVY